MATPPPVTDMFARFVSDTDYSTISETTLANAKMHILDTFGAALAGVATDTASIALDYCRRTGRSDEASIWGTRVKSSAPCMVVGAALSLGEVIGSSGKDLLKAYVLGIEVLTKISAAGPNLQDRGFHSTPVLGSFGAAVACASLLRLDLGKIKAALGVTASAVGGIHRQQGSMVKPFHAANAARSGVEAALLAEKGFTADPAIFEAPRGFCDTFFGKGACDYEKMIADIGKPFFLESPGLGLKMHPCSAPQFLAADAALHLKREHNLKMHPCSAPQFLAADAALHLKREHKIDFAEVAKIEVRIPPERYQRHYHAEVKTGLRAKFAVNYVVALALLDGKLEIATFTDEKANQPQVQDALSKVNVIVDESIPEPGPYCPVSVELKNGTRHSYTARIAKGDPRNPISESEVLDKFRGNARTVISEKQSEELINAVRNLEAIENVNSLVSLLRPA
ncbi:MAG: MmgE/PrpD family protein [Deltaproteobacteria bacterium]|nr:MmgE/PrpD family protein [Deltaproteobacteria bacterium]